MILVLAILGELQQLHYIEPTGGWQAKRGVFVDILKHLTRVVQMCSARSGAAVRTEYLKNEA